MNRKRNRNRQQSDRSALVMTRRLLDLNKQEILRSMPIKPDVEFLRQGVKDKVYTFWETRVDTIIQFSITEQDYAISVTPSNFTNLNSSLNSVFDNYRIISCKVAFHPYSGGANNSAAAIPPTTSAIDYDDSTATTVANLLQYDTAQTVPSGVYFERTFKPRVALAAYSGVFTSFAQSKDQWIDMASLGVIHYGLKIGVPAAASGPSNLYSTTTTICYQCRSSR